MSISGKVQFDVTVTPGTGTFEILEGGSVTATGRVYSLEGNSKQLSEIRTNGEVTHAGFKLTTSDIYKELRLRGYDYGPTFQGIIMSDLEGRLYCHDCFLAITFE